MKQKIVLPARFREIASCYDRDSEQYALCLLGRTSVLRSSGRGQVRAVGFSPEYHHFVCVAYSDVVTVTGEEAGSVLLRYTNLSQVGVRNGQKVKADTMLGLVMSGAQQKLSYELYIEADTDIKYPRHTPSLLKTSGALQAGLRGPGDTTFDPLLVLCR